MTMTSSARRSSASELVPMARRPESASTTEPPIPSQFLCPISLDLMRDPVTAPTGITYDRQSIEGWLERGHQTCPVTGFPVPLEDLIPNHTTRRMIQEWCVENRAFGVERIPTPRIPVSENEVTEILSAIASAGRRGDGVICERLASKVRSLAKESERNRRVFISRGTRNVLSSVFRQLAGEPVECTTFVGVLEIILSALVVFFPLNDEARRTICSPGALRSIVSIMASDDLAARTNAVVVMRELASCLDSQSLEALAKTKGLMEALAKMVEKPISPQATKAALVTSYYLVTSNGRAASRFVDLGLVELLVEMLVDSDKGISEKALAVLDGLFCNERGREHGYRHALAVPVLVKKMFRVSDMATEFAVSALWRLCNNRQGNGDDDDGRSCLVEALQVGAFQKLLLLLQVGCGGVVKERASELLKLLNSSRGSAECIETVDFKGLKRPF